MTPLRVAEDYLRRHGEYIAALKVLLEELALFGRQSIDRRKHQGAVKEGAAPRAFTVILLVIGEGDEFPRTVHEPTGPGEHAPGDKAAQEYVRGERNKQRYGETAFHDPSSAQKASPSATSMIDVSKA